MIEEPVSAFIDGIHTLEICSCSENDLTQDKSCGCQKPGMHLLHPKKGPLIIHFRGQHWSILCFVPYLLRVVTNQAEEYRNLHISHQAQGLQLRKNEETIEYHKTESARLQARLKNDQEKHAELLALAYKMEQWMQDAITQSIDLVQYCSHSDDCNLVELAEAGRIPSNLEEEQSMCDCKLFEKITAFKKTASEVAAAYTERDNIMTEKDRLDQDKKLQETMLKLGSDGILVNSK